MSVKALFTAILLSYAASLSSAVPTGGGPAYVTSIMAFRCPEPAPQYKLLSHYSLIPLASDDEEKDGWKGVYLYQMQVQCLKIEGTGRDLWVSKIFTSNLKTGSYKVEGSGRRFKKNLTETDLMAGNVFEKSSSSSTSDNVPQTDFNLLLTSPQRTGKPPPICLIELLIMLGGILAVILPITVLVTCECSRCIHGKGEGNYGEEENDQTSEKYSQT